ncbi:type II toxin-antitoxin system YafQ family toxin [Endozoicomonas sp. ONNA2]|uniref:type II toxin-antitoxin system YafQ family toxin n=1 Tax=Endozoicomonas sp. ONNA2 TaxID=2828741 RepID=UPI00214896A4|nr:type II toxin-antitoxin system YafQ family toxin [Endozoicomonas sp. ONNA2]
MLTPVYTNKLSKDIKRAKRQGKDLDKFKDVVRMLIEQQPMAAKHKDHALSGNYKNHRECHIEPDWLLIYKVENKRIIFSRLGSHSDLFR